MAKLVCILLTLLCMQAYAQYTGGAGFGNAFAQRINRNLFLLDSSNNGGTGAGFQSALLPLGILGMADSLYNGGPANGFGGVQRLNRNLFLLDSLYNGGVANGFQSEILPAASLGFADSIYNGGRANGFSGEQRLNRNLFLSDSIYNGGAGNGFAIAQRLNRNLFIVDGVYNGGKGNGFSGFIITAANLYLSDSLYNGSIGRGEIQLQVNNISLTVCSDTLVWNGNENTLWSNPNNWNCSSIPGINTTVVIPAGRPRYPLVLANTEIKELILQPGSSVTVASTINFKLNGQ